MKQVLFFLLALLPLFSCSKVETSGDEQKADKRQLKGVERMIYQETDSNGLGMIKNIEIDSLIQLNDSMFVCRVTADNSVLEKTIRLTKIYSFTDDFKSITIDSVIKYEMESLGVFIGVDL